MRPGVSAEKAATETHVSERQRQIQAIDKAQKQTVAPACSRPSCAAWSLQKDASDAVIERTLTLSAAHPRRRWTRVT